MSTHAPEAISAADRSAAASGCGHVAAGGLTVLLALAPAPALRAADEPAPAAPRRRCRPGSESSTSPAPRGSGPFGSTSGSRKASPSRAPRAAAMAWRSVWAHSSPPAGASPRALPATSPPSRTRGSRCCASAASTATQGPGPGYAPARRRLVPRHRPRATGLRPRALRQLPRRQQPGPGRRRHTGNVLTAGIRSGL
jgi:hypothetical protein